MILAPLAAVLVVHERLDLRLPPASLVIVDLRLLGG